MSHLLLVAIVAFAGVLLLAFGWHEVFRTFQGRPSADDRRRWLFCVLLALIVAAAPLFPVVIVAGMERYARVPFVPWVLPLKR
ncbi:MAG TPA: hypothetical protein VHD36_11940 [Pirellulales bacterium]|nr:hypothetical protein [Pirellulales bacterium]